MICSIMIYLETTTNLAYCVGFSALCDLILALYPIVFFWSVRLDRRVKLGLCVLMGLGVVACACAIVKTIMLQVLAETEDVTCKFHVQWGQK